MGVMELLLQVSAAVLYAHFALLGEHQMECLTHVNFHPC